jgi:Transposase DDE domain
MQMGTMVGGSSLNHRTSHSLSQVEVRRLRGEQVEKFSEALPNTLEDIQKSLNRKEHFCLLPFSSGASPQSDQWVQDMNRYKEGIVALRRQVGERNPLQKKTRREEEVWKHIELLRPFLDHLSSQQQEKGKPRMGRPLWDRCSVLSMIVTHKIHRGATWDEMGETIRLRKRSGIKTPSLSTCKRYWKFLKENPEILNQLISFCIYIAKEEGMLNPTVLLVDAMDVPSEDHHELVGWGYKEGKSMRIMALSTSNKILLAHMLVRPDTSEIQCLLPVFNQLPDFIKDNNKHTVGDKAYDSTAHRTEFNTMGKFLHAENRSTAKDSRLTPPEAAVNRVMQLVRHSVENVFCTLKKNRIFLRFREKTSESVRSYMRLAHLTHLLGVLYKGGLSFLGRLDRFSQCSTT